MIARIWHGVTPADKADDYVDYLNRTGVPDYRATEGNRGVYVLRRIEGDRAHFLTLSLWASLDAIRGFAGDDVERARYYPEDADFLLEFEPTVTHYEVVARAEDGA
ncbi:MAG: antibiotic biosynthesis monooxygenase [Anaerolineae bacterium]